MSSASVLAHLPDPCWQAVINTLGDPGTHIRIFAALPAHVLVQGVIQAHFPAGDLLTPLQATQVGLVWRICRKIVHVWAGLPEADFRDEDPWKPADSVSGQVAGQGGNQGGQAASQPSPKERILKMSSLVDQNDESELTPASKEDIDKWINAYVAVMGSAPLEEEEPSEAQLSALNRKVNELHQCPYVDFAVWQPFARRTQKAQKFRTYVPLGDGSYLLKELPGPQNFQQWMTSWRVFKVAAIMLNLVSLASLTVYEKTIERLVILWPKCWGLVVVAEDKGRAERLQRIQRKLKADHANNKEVPPDWSEVAPWTTCFRLLALDDDFWNEQVRHPAASWMAAGERGPLIAAAERAALTHLPGSGEIMDIPKEERDPRKRQSNRDRRTAKARRVKADREELERLRSKDTREHKAGPSGKGKGKSKDQTGLQLCFSFANGTGPCGSCEIGAECQQKVKRAHKCQYCLSPGHRNADCPKVS